MPRRPSHFAWIWRLLLLAAALPLPALAEKKPPAEVLLGVTLRPAWWDRAFEAQVEADFGRRPGVAPRDTTPWTWIGQQDLPSLLQSVLAAPDSAVDRRLWETAWEDSLDLSPLRALFQAISRGRAYQDLKSREAAMYGESLNGAITVPNPDGD